MVVKIKTKQVGQQQLAKGRGSDIKKNNRKVVVLEGGRGVKCVVGREEKEGRAARLMQDFTCSGIHLWTFFWGTLMLKFCFESQCSC